jgi:hypothetical protein
MLLFKVRSNNPGRASPTYGEDMLHSRNMP